MIWYETDEKQITNYLRQRIGCKEALPVKATVFEKTFGAAYNTFLVNFNEESYGSHEKFSIRKCWNAPLRAFQECSEHPCGCRSIGHGGEVNGVFYCCANCAAKEGAREVRDRN